jgi:RNA polymerase sigma factor (sigma-70 family)
VKRLTDSEALRRLRSDPEAICVLYDRYVLRLVAQLARWSGDRELAFDLAQETFARALEHGHRVRVPAGGSAWPWLWSVARNLLADWRRHGVVDASARTRLGIRCVAPEDEATEELVARMDAEALARPLEEALAELPASQREAVAGRVGDGLSYRELALVHGTTEQVIRARVSRGLRALRLRLFEVRP